MIMPFIDLVLHSLLEQVLFHYRIWAACDLNRGGNWNAKLWRTLLHITGEMKRSNKILLVFPDSSVTTLLCLISRSFLPLWWWLPGFQEVSTRLEWQRKGGCLTPPRPSPASEPISCGPRAGDLQRERSGQSRKRRDPAQGSRLSARRAGGSQKIRPPQPPALKVDTGRRGRREDKRGPWENAEMGEEARTQRPEERGEAEVEGTVWQGFILPIVTWSWPWDYPPRDLWVGKKGFQTLLLIADLSKDNTHYQVPFKEMTAQKNPSFCEDGFCTKMYFECILLSNEMAGPWE